MRIVLAVALALAAAAPAQAFDPVYEAKNFSKTNERAAIHSTPEYKALLAQVSTANVAEAVQQQAADSERSFVGQNLCWNWGEGCAGDVRLYDWAAKGYGRVQPVLFTARNGATLSGRIWWTASGPAKRPAVLIVNGSVQAPETLYWFAAQTLAKAGYVVMTFDPQNQGRSDQMGEGADAQEGFPAQSDGRPFFDGAQDALDFLLSTRDAHYKPRPSCNSGTSHEPKQLRRVHAGLNAAYNPLYGLIDHERVGIAGHSYGAAGVSYVGQRDPRVDAVVAWDALREPRAGGPTGEIGPCVDARERAPARITKPALNLTADYGIPPTPNTSDPDFEEKAAVSKAYSAAGVDTGSIAVRGGTHYEFSFIPNAAFPAALRGADLTTWYTTAWLDAYVKGDPTANRRLRTDRWRNDAATGAVDPDGDANIMSRYYRSRMDIAGFTCEDLRKGCPGLLADDGEPRDYTYGSIATRPDAAPQSSACVAAAKVRGGSVRARGRRVAIAAPNGVTYTILRVTARTRTRVKKLKRDGVYVVRFRSRGAEKHVVVTRRDGVYAKRRTFRSLSSCGVIRFASTGRPAFGGRLRAYFRLNVPARVTVTVRRGNKVVRRFKARDRAAGRTYRVSMPARRGAYRVTVSADPAGAPAKRVTVAARRI